jgi:hypothetical protein
MCLATPLSFWKKGSVTGWVPSTSQFHGKSQVLSWVPVAHACNPSCLEAEIRRIVVQGQPRQIVHEPPSPK